MAKDQSRKIQDHSRDQAKEFLLFAGVFTAAFFLIFSYFAFIAPPKISSQFAGEALTPNSQLQLNQGEKYTYFHKSEGRKTNVTYDVFSGFGCLSLVLSSSNYSTQIGCFDKKGNNIARSQSFLEGSMFEGWMLSLSPDFRWSRNITSSLEPMGIRSTIQYLYEVQGMEKKFGRDSYKVKVTVLPQNRVYYEWIDAQKRVLLSLEDSGESFEIATSAFLKRSG